MRHQDRPRPLRRRLMVPLGAAFAALWLGTMALFTGAAVGETERTVDLQYEAAAYWLDLHGQGYQASLTDGIGTEAEAASAYRQILSGETYRLQTTGDGGIAAALREEAVHEVDVRALGRGREDAAILCFVQSAPAYLGYVELRRYAPGHADDLAAQQAEAPVLAEFIAALE